MITKIIYSTNLIIVIIGFVLQSKKSGFILPTILNKFNFVYFSQFILVSFLAITLLYFGGKRLLDIFRGDEQLTLFTENPRIKFLYYSGVSFLAFNLITVFITVTSMFLSRGAFHIALISQSFAFLMPSGFIFIECARFMSLSDSLELNK